MGGITISDGLEDNRHRRHEKSYDRGGQHWTGFQTVCGKIRVRSESLENKMRIRLRKVTQLIKRILQQILY